MTGTNLVAYVKTRDRNAHLSAMNGDSKKTAASRRVYDSIAPAIGRIKHVCASADPDPETDIDDTIADKK